MQDHTPHLTTYRAGDVSYAITDGHSHSAAWHAVLAASVERIAVPA